MMSAFLRISNSHTASLARRTFRGSAKPSFQAAAAPTTPSQPAMAAWSGFNAEEPSSLALVAMTPVFVFGTLKRGFALHDRALTGARYQGQYRTVQRYPMFIAGEWYAPMMMNEPGLGCQIVGELYQVDHQRLLLIDQIESVGLPGNFRVRILVKALDQGTVCFANAYMKSRELASPVHSGLLGDYQDRRFVPPERRPSRTTMQAKTSRAN